MGRSRGVAWLVCGRRTKWAVLLLWVALLAVAVPLAGKLTGAQKNDNSTWLPGSAESTQVMNRQRQVQPTDTADAIVVYERVSGHLTEADYSKVAADARDFAKISGVLGDQVAGPFPGREETAQALAVRVPIEVGSAGWNAIAEVADQVRTIAQTDADGLTVHITGPGGVAADSAKAFEGIDGVLLYATLAVVVVILLLTYRSPGLWLLPVLTAGTALASAQAVIYLLARHSGLTVNGQSAGILTVLVFGAGTDYALLLIARYREELRRHSDRHEAMALALHRAGPAIIASAATVAIGMLCLVIAKMNATNGLGPVAAIGIAVGLLAMITLLPALLVIFGRWLFWPVRPRFGSAEPTATGVWARTGRGIARRPRMVWVVTTLVLGGFALGITGLKADGLSIADQFTSEPDSVVGAKVLARHQFPAGAGQPVVVVGKEQAATELRQVVLNTPGITDVSQPKPAGGYVYLEATLTDPPDSAAAEQTVDRVREAVHQVPGADAKAGGQTAIILDAKRASTDDRNRIIPLVLLVVLLVLILLLRAIVAPLLLIATVVLSFATALGISALVFNHVFKFGGGDPSLPLFVFVFLVALGIDYNIFLMTRVREESARHGTRRGALIGLSATGGVITSAGLVLAGTFAALATLPVVAFAQIGFAVALGVLLDTIVVRSVLVTALNLDLGRWIWWPSRLTAVADTAEPAPEREEAPALAS